MHDTQLLVALCLQARHLAPQPREVCAGDWRACALRCTRLLAATTAEEKLQWMERLRALFAAAAAARATAAAAAAAAPAVDGGTAPQAGSEE